MGWDDVVTCNHRRTQGGTVPISPFWPSNKVLKPNFQSIISQTNDNCSLFSLILAKLLHINIKCENILALSIVTALCVPFFDKRLC